MINTFFSNAGGAVYKGFESGSDFLGGHGFSLYANLTFNSAKQKSTGDWMPNAPQQTAALGVLYERGPLAGSLITKFVGHQFGDTGDTQSDWRFHGDQFLGRLHDQEPRAVAA